MRLSAMTLLITAACGGAASDPGEVAAPQAPAEPPPWASDTEADLQETLATGTCVEMSALSGVAFSADGTYEDPRMEDADKSGTWSVTGHTLELKGSRGSSRKLVIDGVEADPDDTYTQTIEVEVVRRGKRTFLIGDQWRAACHGGHLGAVARIHDAGGGAEAVTSAAIALDKQGVFALPGDAGDPRTGIHVHWDSRSPGTEFPKPELSRALEAALPTHPVSTAGEPLAVDYDVWVGTAAEP